MPTPQDGEGFAVAGPAPSMDVPSAYLSTFPQSLFRSLFIFLSLRRRRNAPVLRRVRQRAPRPTAGRCAA